MANQEREVKNIDTEEVVTPTTIVEDDHFDVLSEVERGDANSELHEEQLNRNKDIVIDYGIKNKKGAFEAELKTKTQKDKKVKKQLLGDEEKLNKFLEIYYNYCIELIYAIGMVFMTECKKSRLRQKKKAFSIIKKSKTNIEKSRSMP